MKDSGDAVRCKCLQEWHSLGSRTEFVYANEICEEIFKVIMGLIWSKGARGMTCSRITVDKGAYQSKTEGIS